MYILLHVEEIDGKSRFPTLFPIRGERTDRGETDDDHDGNDDGMPQ